MSFVIFLTVIYFSLLHIALSRVFVNTKMDVFMSRKKKPKTSSIVVVNKECTSEILGQIVRIHSLLDSNGNTGTVLQYCTILLLTLPCLNVTFRYVLLRYCIYPILQTLPYVVIVPCITFTYCTLLCLTCIIRTMTSNLNKLSKNT